MKQILFVLPLAAVLTLSAAPASAQIYSWRDARGSLVLSTKRPADSNVQSFAVSGTSAMRVTTPSAVRLTPQYDALIQEHSTRHGVRPDLVRAVIQVESGFNSRAVSPKGAMGLMQLMPATAAELGVRNAFDPVQNINAGVGYLRRLLDRYDDNEALALAAYNAGPGAVDRYGSQVPPYRETKDYVKRIQARAGTVRAAGSGVSIYKSTEVVNGQAIPRYSDTKPSSGLYELIPGRR